MSDLFGRFKRMFIMGLRQLQDPYYQGFAAQISFYLLMSIVPIILLMIQFLGLFDISMQSAMNLIEEYTGDRMSGLLSTIFEFSYIGYGNIVFVIIALWAGSRASFAIARIANYTFTEGDNTGKNYFLERARAILTMMLTLITLVVAIVILLYGKVILIGILNLLNLEAANYVDNIWLYLRWPLGFVLYFLVIGVNYYIIPTKKKSIKRVLPGTIFAAFGMVIVSWFYSFYTSTLVHYDLMYGALSSVVAIMIWFLLLSWVIILGVLCNKLFEDTSVPFSKRTPVDYPDKWRRSKFDMDPDDVDMGAIMGVFMGNISGDTEDKTVKEPETEKHDD
ncbi:MAG: YihY/virulence factor BrkB family protein [Bacillota bacterium]|nr:YihY/virulence factor BrkB family protein [Bacillota bacterium]